jgi:hypothetical protein
LRRLGQEWQACVNNCGPVNHLAIVQLLVIQLRLLSPLTLEVLLPLLRQYPLLGELKPLLRLVMSKVKRHIFEVVLHVFRLFDQGCDGLTQETLVLRLSVEFLARHLDDIRRGVIAGTGEFDDFGVCGFAEREIIGIEFDDNLIGCGVRFVEVGSVAEAEGCC